MQENAVKTRLSKAEMISEIISMRKSYSPHLDVDDLYEWLLEQKYYKIQGIYYQEKRKKEKKETNTNQISIEDLMKVRSKVKESCEPLTILKNECLFLLKEGYIITQLTTPSFDQYGKPISDLKRMEIAEENQLKLERVYRDIGN